MGDGPGARGSGARVSGIVRDAAAEDLAQVRDIYARHVLVARATFELEPPTVAEMERRWQALCEAGLPYLVSVVHGRVVGFGYCASYRPRAAYRYTVEDSVYLTPEAQGQGLGRALLSELIERCTRQGYRQMVAVVGDSANRASVAVHRALGFVEVGTLRDVGYKHGRWVNTVVLQRALGAGGRSDPARGPSNP